MNQWDPEQGARAQRMRDMESGNAAPEDFEDFGPVVNPDGTPTEATMRILGATYCTMQDGSGRACGMVQGHKGRHVWSREVVAPTEFRATPAEIERMDSIRSARPEAHQRLIDKAMKDYDRTGLCDTAGRCSCKVEAEGRCQHGAPSVLLAAGLA